MFLTTYDKKLAKIRKNSYRLMIPNAWLKKIKKRYPESFEHVKAYAGRVLIIVPKEIRDEVEAKCYRFLESLEPVLQEIKTWKPEGR